MSIKFIYISLYLLTRKKFHTEIYLITKCYTRNISMVLK